MSSNIPLQRKGRLPVRTLLALSLASLLVALTCAADLPDEVFDPGNLVSGVSADRAGCETQRDTVWVTHAEGQECIRYFASANARGAPVAALFFHGDRLDGRFAIAYKDNRASVLQAQVEGLARVNGVPYVYVARPGTYGSSGRHTERRRLKEYLSMNAAVDAIKARLGLSAVHLGGQSGGAAVVGALLTLGRTDVRCAVASSGPYDAIGRANTVAAQTGRGQRGCDTTGWCDPYNVVDHVAGVKADPARRILLVGDPADTNTPFVFQQAFADRLREAGHAAVLLPAEANGPQRHSLQHMTNRMLGWCNAGLSDDEIARLVADKAPALHARKAGSKEALE